MGLAQGHHVVTRVRLEPLALNSNTLPLSHCAQHAQNSVILKCQSHEYFYEYGLDIEIIIVNAGKKNKK